MLRCYSVLTALLLVVVGGRGLQLTPRGVGGVQVSDDAALLRRNRQSEPAQTGCPNYVAGISPKNRAREGCVVGEAIGQVDHERAFGFPPEPSRVDWRACNLPEYPAEK